MKIKRLRPASLQHSSVKISDVLAEHALEAAGDGKATEEACAEARAGLVALMRDLDLYRDSDWPWPFHTTPRTVIANARKACWKEGRGENLPQQVREQAETLLVQALCDYLRDQALQRTMRQRAETAFGRTGTPQFAEEYLSAVLSVMGEIRSNERRSSTMAIGLAALFLLLRQTGITRLQFGGVEIRDLAFVEEAVPAVFAYLIYDLVALSLRSWYSRLACVEILRITREPVWRTGLHRLLYNHASSLFGSLWLATDGGMDRTAHVLRRGISVSAVLVPTGFELYAFTTLFLTFGFRHPWLWLSALLAGWFGAYAIVLFLIARKTVTYPRSTV
jgi:hypothetical protein